MKALTTFWWVRHAPVVGYDGRRYGSLDVDCDVSDEVSFRTLRSLLPDSAVIATSGLLRACKTADTIIAQGLHPLERLADSDLGEQNFGEWQGLSHQEVHLATCAADARHPHWVVAPDHVPPGGESFMEMADRVVQASDRLLRDHTGHDVVVVSHGGPIRAICARDPGWNLERALALHIQNLSVTRIEGSMDTNNVSSWKVDWTGRTGKDRNSA